MQRIDPLQYDPNFLTKKEADELFTLCQTLPRIRKPVRGKPARRLSPGGWNDYGTFRGECMCHGRAVSHSQPGDEIPLLDAAPRPIKDLAIKLSLYAMKPVNYFGVVGYENEKDHIHPHQHDEDRHRDARAFDISLGETRTFGLREICSDCRVCYECNAAACDGYIRRCGECAAAKQHKKHCTIANNKANWLLLQPTHGSLIVIPSDCNWTHEHMILDDKTPKGLRFSINTKHLPIDESLEDFIARMELPSAVKHVPQVFDCHADKKYPNGAIYVGCKTLDRKTGETTWEGSIFGNAKDPFANPGHPDSHSRSPMGKTAAEFREYAVKRMQEPEFAAQVEALRGHDLLCWCEPSNENCHAKIWLELANRTKEIA